MTAPLFVVCVDGGDDRVVREMMGEGRLPALAALRDRGVEVGIETPGDLLEESVWPPILSGQPVGNYGLAFSSEFEPESMGIHLRREADLEPFWLHLPARGQGALAFDVPEMHPHPDTQADEVCGWSTVSPAHDPAFAGRALKPALRRFRRPFKLRDRPARTLTFAEEWSALRAMGASLGVRARAFASVAAGREVSCVGIHETHAVTHWFGHHFDPEHWYRPSKLDPELVRQPYAALDAALGPLLTRDANAVVVFAKGIRPVGSASHLLEGLLERAGLLVRRGAGFGPPGPQGERAWLTESARRLVPERARESLARRLLSTSAQFRLAARRFRDQYVWTQTQVFAVPSWSAGLIRVNASGREAAGIVPREEIPNVLERTTRLILETQDAATGRPLAAEVIRAQQVFPGARSYLLPDLLVTWRVSGLPRSARHPVLGRWEAAPQHGRVTEHGGSGLVLLAGPDIRRIESPLREDPLGLAPTLLALKRVRRPSVMPEAPWSDVLTR